MWSRGLRSRVRFLPSVLKLAMLSAIVLIILLFRKKKTSLNSAMTIFSALKYYGLSDQIASYATAQAAHETADFTSQLFKENNNAFGMTYVGQSTANGERSRFAYYDDIEHSAEDMAVYYVKSRAALPFFPLFINSIEKYVTFLKNRGFFTAPLSEYLAGCQNYYTKYFGTA
jgi:hypothetical protein